MQVILFDIEKNYTLTLPSAISGKFWMENIQSRGETKKVLAVEADMERNAWMIRKGNGIQGMIENDCEVDKIWLKAGNVYRIFLRYGQVHEAFLLAEEEDESFQRFTKYKWSGNGCLTIGRSAGQCIQLNNSMVSGEHLMLSRQNDSWAILNAPGKNGTYINSVKVDGAIALKPGDVISILYYKIVIGYDFIAINNPNHTVSINTDMLTVVHLPGRREGQELSGEALAKKMYFYRSPHFLEEMKGGQITVDLPPSPEQKDNTPILLTIAPAMLMALASLSTGIISVISTIQNNGSMIRALPTIIMSVSMLGGMIIFPIIIKKREGKLAQEREEERQKKYIHYLQKVREEISKVCLWVFIHSIK